jgi:hypothetical protein
MCACNRRLCGCQINNRTDWSLQVQDYMLGLKTSQDKKKDLEEDCGGGDRPGGGLEQEGGEEG